MLSRWDGMNHGFLFWIRVVDRADTAMAEACAWLRRAFAQIFARTAASEVTIARAVCQPEAHDWRDQRGEMAEALVLAVDTSTGKNCCGLWPRSARRRGTGCRWRGSSHGGWAAGDRRAPYGLHGDLLAMSNLFRKTRKRKFTEALCRRPGASIGHPVVRYHGTDFGSPSSCLSRRRQRTGPRRSCGIGHSWARSGRHRQCGRTTATRSRQSPSRSI